MKKNNSSRDAAIALLLSGLFVLIVALISLSPDENKSIDLTRNSKEDARPIDLVNKHLREVYDQQEIDRLNAENMNLVTAPPLHKAPPVEPVFHFDEMPISFDQDSLEEVVGQDLRIYASSQARQKTLSEQIQQEIIDDIKKSAEEEVYQKALADSIIKKARSQGFDVQVDENFKIKSVRKIVIKEAPSLFDPNNLPNR
jgi:hypothetical protein